MTHRLCPLLAAGACVLAPAAPTLAATDDGLFSVTPARQVVNGRPPRALQPFSVSNTTKVPLKVLVIPGILDQRLSGEIFFKEDPASLRTARQILTPDRDHFRLAPGQRQSVHVDWRLRPLDQKVLNMGVIFQSTAATNSSAVSTVQRLLTMDFLQLPGRHTSTGQFVSLRAEQGAGKTLDLIPRIENTGDVVQSPRRGKIIVRDASNRLVYRALFVGDVILPDHQRDFPVNTKKVLPAGRYRMAATADFGSSRHMHIRGAFRLVGPNELPSPKVAVEHLAGHGTIGGDSEATAIVHSVGSATADTNVKVQLFRLTKTGQRPEQPLKEQKLRYTALAPGARRPLRIVYPDLPAGKYRIIATYRDTPDTVAQVEADFSPVAPAKDSGSLVGPILGAAGLGAAGLFLFFFWKRRRRRDDDEEAGEFGPPPTTPAVNGRVDVNLASLDELQLLPGIGPKAAQRIVDRRDEYGSFATLEDLGKVEGLSGERLEALADRVKF